MSPSQMLKRISAYHNARETQKLIYQELTEIAVTELNVPHEISKRMNVADYIEGYLAAVGVKFPAKIKEPT